jgi:hypothetical protein
MSGLNNLPEASAGLRDYIHNLDRICRFQNTIDDDKGERRQR